MIESTLDEQKEYENAMYCHICKKEFGDKKKPEKYVIMIIALVYVFFNPCQKKKYMLTQKILRKSMLLII